MHSESKDDDIYLDEASTPGSLGSAGGLNSASNRQRALEEQKKRLMRKQQMRRGSAGAVQANRAFTGAAKKIPISKTGSSFRNFSAPKAIDPLEGEEDDDEGITGLRKTGYADSFRGSSRNASGSYGGVYEALHQPLHQTSSVSSETYEDARVANVKTTSRPSDNQNDLDGRRRAEGESKFADKNRRDAAEAKSQEPVRESFAAEDRTPAIAEDFEEAPVRRKSSSKSRSQRKKESSKTSSSSGNSSSSGTGSKSRSSTSKSRSSSRRKNYNSDDAVEEEESADLSPEAELSQNESRRKDADSVTSSTSRRQQRAALAHKQEVASSASEDEDAAEMIVPRPPKKSSRVKKSAEKTRKSRKDIESKSGDRASAAKDVDEVENDSDIERKESEDHFDEVPRNGLHTKTLSEAPQIDLTDMRAFLMNPVPRAYGTLQCYIERNKSGANKLYPEFQVFLKDGDRFLMSGKKRSKNRTTNYVVTMDPRDYNRESPNCLGKLRSNFIGTEFQIFDKGVNPKNADPDSLHVGTTPVREELGAILYNSNVLGSRGPRKMKVAVPVVDEKTNKRKTMRSSKKGDELLGRFKDRDMGDLVELINKPPRWNDHVGAYVLNFNGRVTMASVKNFQLITAENEDEVILTFGRCGTNLFSMDVAWPLSPFQAFCIAMSSASSKLACE
ncbi:Tubby protein-like [Hondaea fermentalgiana]|uniref:Tubby protein-like n=1 Tax=Hondaea fermentalgiana TaxID=2315210 RepID=A0A2R5GXE9_9STRA|nr:Tubby protein-like [Hondaea fermentalgiana]|eukprot:GBG32634.1 Tubby protein-like [Hondaea fermentalgiana]